MFSLDVECGCCDILLSSFICDVRGLRFRIKDTAAAQPAASFVHLHLRKLSVSEVYAIEYFCAE
jgi:hypothetical protein